MGAPLNDSLWQQTNNDDDDDYDEDEDDNVDDGYRTSYKIYNAISRT